MQRLLLSASALALFTFGSAQAPRANGRTATIAQEGDRKVIRLDDGKGDGMVWFPDVTFDTGTVELDVRGRDVPQRSFLGVVYHIRARNQYDVIYLRPFNFRSTDSAKHAHAIQYVSAPNFNWDSLRAHFPGQYENPLTPAPDPTSWVHMRVELALPDVRVYINGSKTPALQVKDLGGHIGGSIGIWVGDCSNGEFSNIRATPHGKPSIDLSAQMVGTITAESRAVGECP